MPMAGTSSGGSAAWDARRRHPGALLAALVVTLGVPLLLVSPARQATPHVSTPAPTWLRLLPLPDERPSARQAPSPTVAAAQPPVRMRPVRPLAPLTSSAAASPAPRPAPQDPQPITVTSPPVMATPAPAPAPVASAPPPPLRLGDDVMRQAARDSIAETRRLAAEAGLPAERDRSSDERLAGAVEQAVKPDCLASNAGGSLLSIPLIALQALRQKCN